MNKKISLIPTNFEDSPMKRCNNTGCHRSATARGSSWMNSLQFRHYKIYRKYNLQQIQFSEMFVKKTNSPNSTKFMNSQKSFGGGVYACGSSRLIALSWNITYLIINMLIIMVLYNTLLHKFIKSIIEYINGDFQLHALTGRSFPTIVWINYINLNIWSWIPRT